MTDAERIAALERENAALRTERDKLRAGWEQCSGLLKEAIAVGKVVEASNEAARAALADLLPVLEGCEKFQMIKGDPFRGDDWEMMQDIRRAIGRAREVLKGGQP